MIDMETYHQSHQKDEDDGNSPQHDLVQVDMEQPEPPDEDFAIMAPPQIRGFGMHDKRWSTSISPSSILAQLKIMTYNDRAYRGSLGGAHSDHTVEQDGL